MPKARAISPSKKNPAAAPARPARTGIFLAAGAIVLAGAAAYANSFSGPFVLDDPGAIVTNPSIRELWPLWSAMWAPLVIATAARPVLNLSLALNYAWGGLDVHSYHVANLAIHLLAGLTLFGVARRTLLHWQPARPGNPATAVPFSPLLPALAVALLWLLHPLQTESVTYVSGRAESLMGLFYLLTLYFFIRYAEDGKTIQAVLSVFFCMLGAATKEVTATAPLVVLLYDRTFVSGTFKAAWRRRWKYYLLLTLPWLMLAYQLSNVRERGVGLNLGGSWWDYAVMEAHVIMRYLGLAAWPHPLVIDYGRGVSPAAWSAAPYVVAVLLLVALAAWALFRRAPQGGTGRALGFAGAWFFLILAPTSSVVAVANQPMAEHRLYLPLVALTSVVVLAARRWLGRSGVVACLVLAVAGGVATARRNADYRTELALWTVTAAQQPDNARVQTNLATALEAAGRTGEAQAHFEAAIRAMPDYAEGRLNLGNFLLRQRRPAEAIAPCEAALRLNPSYPEAHYILGVVQLQLGRTGEAFAHFDAALRLRPNYVDVEHTLAGALVMTGRTSEALTHYEAALKLQADNPGLQFEFGNVLFALRRFADAAEHYGAAVQLSPSFADAHNNLGNALVQLGRLDAAEAEYETVLRLKPDDELARDNLALLRRNRR